MATVAAVPRSPRPPSFVSPTRPILFGVGYNRAMPPLLPDVRAMAPEISAWRRDFHEYPELAYAETRTAARVVDGSIRPERRRTTRSQRAARPVSCVTSTRVV